MENTKEQLRREFQEYVEAGLWQGEDEQTKNFPVGNVADWWIAKIDQVIGEHNARILNEYQNTYLGEDERKLFNPIEKATNETLDNAPQAEK